jgi:hypothetical protein
MSLWRREHNMEVIGPAEAAPKPEELLEALAKPFARVMSAEAEDETEIDWIWILRRTHKASLYYRDLAYFAPALYQGLVDATGIDAGPLGGGSGGEGATDYTQNIYRGYCRKLEAVLGTRIPNAVAVPDDPSNEADITAARAANNAALYIRQECDLQVLILWMVFSLFNFGTSFWTLDMVEDGEKFGWKEIPDESTESLDLGGGFECPECAAPNAGDARPDVCEACGAGMEGAMYKPPSPAEIPSAAPPKRVAKSGLVIDITDGSEVRVPLDTDGRKGVSDARKIRREKEVHKSKLFAKYGRKALQAALKSQDNSVADGTTATSQYARSVRSSMASPIGIVRAEREHYWTEAYEDWSPDEFEMIDSDDAREMAQKNFPEGVRIWLVKDHIVKLEPVRLVDRWQECQPEPTKRIMCEPLGEDWIQTQDICNAILNQSYQTIERSNEPGFADPTRVDLEAWERRRSSPGGLIPAMRPAGGTLADIIYRPPPVTFSEQIPAVRAGVEETARQNSGLLDIIWGGDTSDPTARQSELKTNAAIRQLSVIWVMMAKSLEGVYEKGCKLLSETEDGVIAFSRRKENEFGKFEALKVALEDLRGGKYHFEADEAIPMTWGQQRDLLMWMLDKPAEVLKAWGLDDPLNVPEFKSLLGMPGMHVPNLAQRDKGMDIINKLVEAVPTPGEVDPETGEPGPPQPSILPDWEDDVAFLSELVKKYLVDHAELRELAPDGYDNIQLYGQECEKRATPPPEKQPVKATVSYSVKAGETGDAATQAALVSAGIVPEGTQVVAPPPPLPPGMGPGMPPAGGVM